MINRRELLISRNSGRPAPLVDRAPILTSANLDWRGMLLEVHEIPSYESNDVFLQNDTVFLHLSEPVTVSWKDDEQVFSRDVLQGHVTIIPRWLRHSARCDATCRFLMLSLTPDFLADSVAEWGTSDRLELSFAYSHDDPFVRELCLALMKELETGASGGRLYGESLGASLAVHLIQNYSSGKTRAHDCRGGLAKYKLRQAVEFIHSNLAEDFSLKTLSDLVALSPFHFTRMFKKSTGLPPHQYLIKCRVKRAKQLLLSSSESLANIAVQSGFCDQSHFTAHFKRAYGVTPKTFLHHETRTKQPG